jgi:hypothetical protein
MKSYYIYNRNIVESSIKHHSPKPHTIKQQQKTDIQSIIDIFSIKVLLQYICMDCRGRDCLVVGFRATYTIVKFMVFNANFNNISVILWLSVLLVEETRVPEENHQPVTSH